MNSFKSVFAALKYEEERQRKVADEGGQLVQETRGWIEDEGVAFSQRSKEFAHDYRYFPEPDLPPLTPGEQWIDEMRAALPDVHDVFDGGGRERHHLSELSRDARVASERG